MDDCTRPPQKRHRSAAQVAAALVVILLTAPQLSLATTNTNPSHPSPATVMSTTPSAHEISITNVKSGQEGLQLSARFTEQTAETIRDIAWIIKNITGEKVFDANASVAEVTLPPGEYRISARYGAAEILQGVTVHSGTKLSVSFVLKAGALRILPRIKGLTPQTIPSLVKVFALSGPLNGQLISTSNTPGEVLKISAGVYRVESRFANGNAVAVTDVKVNPGIMSAVNVDHIAGIAKLIYLGSESEDVRWIIRDHTGKALPTLFGPEADLVLNTGHYQVDAIANNQTLSTSVDIAQGKTSIVNLGN